MLSSDGVPDICNTRPIQRRLNISEEVGITLKLTIKKGIKVKTTEDYKSREEKSVFHQI